MFYPQNAEMLVEPEALAAPRYGGGNGISQVLVGAGDEWSRRDSNSREIYKLEQCCIRAFSVS